MIKLNPELLERYAKPGARYTSYPMAVEFADKIGPDDRIRREVITELMCNGVVEISEVEERYGIGFWSYFGAGLEALTGPGAVVAEGMVRIDDDAIVASALGRGFIRNVAMAFDAHLAQTPAQAIPVFRRTV